MMKFLRLFVVFICISFCVFCEEFTLDLDRVQAHIQKRFLESCVNGAPFPYLVIEEILPSDLYEKLISSWPKKEFEEDHSEWRKAISINKIKKWDHSSEKLWREFSEKIMDGIIKKEVVKAFLPFLPFRFKKNEIKKLSFTNGSNQCDHRFIEDYFGKLGPHIDQGYVFAPIMLYFPNVGDLFHEYLGTCLYKHKKKKQSLDCKFVDQNKVKLVQQVSYKPNTLVVFLQSPKSWHGTANLYPEGYVRRLYFTNIYLTKQSIKDIYGNKIALPEEEIQNAPKFWDYKHKF